MDFSGNERTRQARKSISAAISLVLSLTLVIAALCPVAGAASGLTADPIPKPPYRLHLSSTVNNSDLTPPTSQPGEHGVAWVDPEEANVGETVRIGGFGFGTDASQVVVWFSFWEKKAQGKIVSRPKRRDLGGRALCFAGGSRRWRQLVGRSVRRRPSHGPESGAIADGPEHPLRRRRMWNRRSIRNPGTTRIRTTFMKGLQGM